MMKPATLDTKLADLDVGTGLQILTPSVLTCRSARVTNRQTTENQPQNQKVSVFPQGTLFRPMLSGAFYQRPAGNNI